MQLANKVCVKKAGNKGRGIFATATILPYEVIEIAPYIKVPAQDYDSVGDSMLQYYWYAIGNSNAHAIGLGYTSLYNHDAKPNAEYTLNHSKRIITITSCKKIVTGKEICIDYGYNPTKV
jgi:hypothetical protein